MCWGSDFPVVQDSMTYKQTIEALRKYCSFIEEEDMIYIPLQQELIRFYMSKVQVKNGKQKTPMEDLMVDTSKK